MTPKVLRKLAVPMLAAAMLFTAVPETAVIKDPFTVTAEAASKKKQAKKTSAKKSSKKTSKKKTVAVPTDLITDKNVVMKLKKKGSASIRVAGPKNYKISVSDKRLVSFKKVGKKVKVTAKNKTGIAIVRITSSAKGRKSVNQFIVFVDPKKNNSGKMPKYRVTSTTKKWARLGKYGTGAPTTGGNRYINISTEQIARTYPLFMAVTNYKSGNNPGSLSYSSSVNTQSAAGQNLGYGYNYGFGISFNHGSVSGGNSASKGNGISFNHGSIGYSIGYGASQSNHGSIGYSIGYGASQK